MPFRNMQYDTAQEAWNACERPQEWKAVQA